MTSAPQLEAAATAFTVLADLGRRGCLIGGLAVRRWGQPRVTQDVDLTLLAPLGSEHAIVDQLLQRLSPRMADARRFALERRVLLCAAPNGVSVDISLAALPFEEEVLARASRWRQVGGVWLPTCSAEDLIIHHAQSSQHRKCYRPEHRDAHQGWRFGCQDLKALRLDDFRIPLLLYSFGVSRHRRSAGRSDSSS